uniref:Uncharacterized protein n=1 Tax=Panagrolaimus davidi TaxID=227884 RepID=A0A914PY90_9BILA
MNFAITFVIISIIAITSGWEHHHRGPIFPREGEYASWNQMPRVAAPYTESAYERAVASSRDLGYAGYPKPPLSSLFFS